MPFAWSDRVRSLTCTCVIIIIYNSATRTPTHTPASPRTEENPHAHTSQPPRRGEPPRTHQPAPAQRRTPTHTPASPRAEENPHAHTSQPPRRGEPPRTLHPAPLCAYAEQTHQPTHLLLARQLLHDHEAGVAAGYGHVLLLLQRADVLPRPLTLLVGCLKLGLDLPKVHHPCGSCRCCHGSLGKDGGSYSHFDGAGSLEERAHRGHGWGGREGMAEGGV